MSANTEAQAGAARSDEVGRCGGIAPAAIVGNYLIATLCCRCVRWP